MKAALTALALSAALPALSLPAESYAATSALSTGRWVKIKVERPGIQQITSEQLSEAGFPDPERVGVYGFSTVDIADHTLSESKPDDLPAIPAIVSAGKLIFYAEAGDRCGVGLNSSGHPTPAYRQNPSSTAGYYFLHETDAPARPAASPAEPDHDAEAKESYLVLLMKKYLDRYHTGTGTNILSDNIVELPNRRITHTFDVERPEPGQHPTYHISYAAYSPDINGKISVSYPDGIYNYTLTGTSTSLFNRSYNNTATIKPLTTDCSTYITLAARSDNLEFAAVNYAAMLYYRLGEFVDDLAQLSFYNAQALRAGHPMRFTNITSPADFFVWDVTTPSAPLQLSVSPDGENAAVAINNTDRPGDSLSRFIAFKADGELNSVEILDEAANSDLHSTPTPDILIVTIPALRQQAERLAELHRRRGMDAAVADHMTIFNEFSSGTPSADAIRRFAKMLYDRDPGKLRHLVLLGPSYVNPRGIDDNLCPDIETYIPTFPTEDVTYQFNIAKCYSTDSFFGVLADGPLSVLTSRMDINVGRIPAFDGAEADAYISKAERYLTIPAETDVRSRAISIGDRGNSSGHTLQAIEASDYIASLAPGTHIYRDYDPVYYYTENNPVLHHQYIAEHLQQGVSFLTYCGHGNEIDFGSAPIWGRRTIAATPIASPPFVMLATCNAYPFDLPASSLGHSFITSPDRGAIALIASCREVQMSLNQRIQLAVISQYYSPEPPATLGDVYRQTYNKIKSEGSENHTINTLCYNFAGDPSLPLYTYTHTLAPDAGILTLTPHSTENVLTGSVTLPDGSTDTDFDGTIIAELYSPPYTINVYQHASSDTLKRVTLDGDLLATTRAPVTAGRYEFNFDTPAVVTPGSGYKLHLAALRSGGSHDRAATTLADITVGDAPEQLPDLPDAPSITSLSIVGAGSDGIIEDNIVTFHAEWRTPYTLSHRGVASVSRFEIDGKRIQLSGIASFASDGTGSLDYTTLPLAPGKHNATLSLTDHAGRTARSSLTFTIVGRRESATLIADRRIASEKVTIDLDHTFASAPAGRLCIIDRNGTTVHTVANPTFPYVWDCLDAGGNRVADGLYTIRAWLSSGDTNCEAARTEVIVIE